jgi:hypothetical protein
LKSLHPHIKVTLNLKRLVLGSFAAILLFFSGYAGNITGWNILNKISTKTNLSSSSVFKDKHLPSELPSILFFESSNSEEEVQENDINDHFLSSLPGFLCKSLTGSTREDRKNPAGKPSFQRPPYYILYHSLKVFCA